jgi:succinate dehydrogenase/fumarate reductase cytochrome b subunit
MNTTLKKCHRFSGIIIAAFLLLHIVNHLFALGGPSMHIAVMNLFRHVYRFLPIEVLLLASVLFQIISGIVLVFKKGFSKQPAYVVIQVLSGLYLSFFMIYHVRAVMLGRYQWHVNTDFYFAAGVANQYPSKLFFIPYYTLSLVCVFAHIACVHYIKRMEAIDEIPNAVAAGILLQRYKRETLAIALSGGVITLLIMLALCGVLYTI